jgi:hypothetical protein
MRRLLFVFFSLLFVLRASLGFAAFGDGYKLYDLGTLEGGSLSVPYVINDSGRVAGQGRANDSNFRPVLFARLQGGPNLDLGPAGSVGGAVRGINDTGQLVGYSTSGAFLFDPSGGGNNVSLGAGLSAYAINDSGIVVGAGGNGAASKAWLWDLNASVIAQPLGNGSAVAINNTGTIVGSSYPSGNLVQATLFSVPGTRLLGTLPGDVAGNAEDVNDLNQIVGISGGAQGTTATLFDHSGNGNNIAIGAHGVSAATAINNAGLVVGEQNHRATLFDITGNMNNIDLNSLLDPGSPWTLTRALAINDLGWIVGYGNRGGFLLAPAGAFPDYRIPEPQTCLLCTLACAALLQCRKR